MRKTLQKPFAFLAFIFFCTYCLQANKPKNIKLQEKIGTHWQQQLVHWPLPDNSTDWTLVDKSGRAIPTQVNKVKPYKETPLNGRGLYTLVDLKPNEIKTFKWKKGKNRKKNSQLKIIKKKSGMILSNGILKVKLPKEDKRFKGGNAPGPIQGIQFGKGKWFGSSTLISKNVKRISVKVLAKGPIYIEAEVIYKWDPKDIFYRLEGYETKRKYYRTRIRLVANQPLIYIEGKWNTDEKTQLNISYKNFPKVDRYHGRALKNNYHTVHIYEKPIDKNTTNITTLSPWQTHGNGNLSLWFAAWNSKQKSIPVLAMFPTFPQTWKTNNLYHRYGNATYSPEIFYINHDEKKNLTMQTRIRHQGTHSFAIHMNHQKEFHEKKPSGMAYIKRSYFDTPLQRVKDWVLDWPVKIEHPHLFFEKNNYTEIREKLKVSKGFQTIKKQKKLEDFLENLTLEYISTGDKNLLKKILSNSELPYEKATVILSNKGLLWELRARMHTMFEGNGLTVYGINDIMFFSDNLLYRLITADVLLGSPDVTEATKKEIRRILAILAYQMERPEWMPALDSGFKRGMPNFATPFYATLGMIGALLIDHPHSKQWIEKSKEELIYGITWQSKPDGAWYESYFYQERTMRGFVIGASALSRKGITDLFSYPRALSVFKAQIQQLSPVDPRLGHRVYPPIGDGTYNTPKLNLFWAAKQVDKTHPKLASEMIWSWEQQGKPLKWLFNAYDPYTIILGDETIPSQAPENYTSHVFDEAAIILRSRYNSKFESYFHLRASNFARSHFQLDQLSYHWYAKGFPISLDWGRYGIGRHRSNLSKNQLVVHGQYEEQARIVQASFSESADYVHVEEMQRDRVRRLLYIRGDDESEPEYVLLRDYLYKPGQVNYWTMASGVRFNSNSKECSVYPKTEDEFKKIITQSTSQSRSKRQQNLAQLRLPILLTESFTSLELGLKPFTVSLKEPWVRYRCTYGADLKIQWFSEIDKVEMAADQWWWYKGDDPKQYVKIYNRQFNEMHKLEGEHQKMLGLHKNKSGDYLTILYPTIDGEVEPEVIKWGEGVKIRRKDNIVHYAWISNPIHQRMGKSFKVEMPFKNKKDGISAMAQAFLIKEEKEKNIAHLYQGTKLTCKWLSIQSKQLVTVRAICHQGKVMLDIENSKRAQPLSLKWNGFKDKILISKDSTNIPYTLESKKYSFNIPRGASYFVLENRID